MNMLNLKFDAARTDGVLEDNAPAGTTVRLTMVFGRKNRGSNVSSPSTLTGAAGGAACTVFASYRLATPDPLRYNCYIRCGSALIPRRADG